MGIVKELFKKGIIGGPKKLDETPINLSNDELQKLKQGEAVIVEHSKGVAVLKIKPTSLDKPHITNEDLDIRQVARETHASRDVEI